MKILIADDEREIRKILTLLLEKHGHNVITAANGEEAVELLGQDNSVDLCIMDIMMPKVSGIEAVKRIRNFSTVPVLFLTAKSLDGDKEEAYGVGGDDYLVKPFSSGELLMKVDAMTRRYNKYSGKPDPGGDMIKLGYGVMINPEQREVYKMGEQLDVRDKEMDMLLYFAANRGRVISTDELYLNVWGEKPLQTSGNTVTVHILSLRKKLEDKPSAPKLIRTVWGRGYQVD